MAEPRKGGPFTEVVEELHRLHADLESFHALLGREVEPENIARSWERCESYNGFLQHLLQQPMPEDEPQRGQLVCVLERLVRLNAIIGSAVQRQKSEMVLQLEKARKTLEKLKCFRPLDKGGDSCDIEG